MKAKVKIRQTRLEDYPSIHSLCQEVYPGLRPWGEAQIRSHLAIFPEGQMVAEDAAGHIIGMTASLIVRWDDYCFTEDWLDFTDDGFFTNHDPQEGRTLYGAEVMVAPRAQGQGVGKKLYRERENLVRRLSLARIRAGARLRSFHKHASEMGAQEYVDRVVAGELGDPTLSFQLKRGFQVLAVVPSYLPNDPESLGWAAVIEWPNPDVKIHPEMARTETSG